MFAYPIAVTSLEPFLTERRAKPDAYEAQLAFGMILLAREADYRGWRTQLQHTAFWVSTTLDPVLNDSSFAEFPITRAAAEGIRASFLWMNDRGPFVDAVEDLFGYKREAAEGLANVLRDIKKHLPGHLVLAQLWRDLHHEDRAIDVAGRAVALEPTNLAALAHLSLASTALADEPNGASYADMRVDAWRRARPLLKRRRVRTSSWDFDIAQAERRRFIEKAATLRAKRNVALTPAPDEAIEVSADPLGDAIAAGLQPIRIADVLGASSDLDVITGLSTILFARELVLGIRGLSAAERVFYTVDGLLREVNNGGFDQYFWNSAGDHAVEALTALRTIGATRTATLLERALKVFGGAPSPDRDERGRQLDAVPRRGGRSTFASLDNAFYKNDDEIEQRLADFARAHASDFGDWPAGTGED